jgi:hypothetical protein
LLEGRSEDTYEEYKRSQRVLRLNDLHEVERCDIRNYRSRVGLSTGGHDSASYKIKNASRNSQELSCKVQRWDDSEKMDQESEMDVGTTKTTNVTIGAH